MNKDLRKKSKYYLKVSKLLASIKFSIALGIGAVLITILTSLLPSLGISSVNIFSVLILPLIMGGMGISAIILTIPLSKIYYSKYLKIANKLENKKIKKEREKIKREEKTIKIKEEKKINPQARIFINASKEFNFIASSKELEWEEYLNNTISDEESIIFVKKLFSYLKLLSNKDDLEILAIIDNIKEDRELLELLSYFSNKGNILNDEVIKKGRIKSS